LPGGGSEGEKRSEKKTLTAFETAHQFKRRTMGGESLGLGSSRENLASNRRTVVGHKAESTTERRAGRREFDKTASLSSGGIGG